MNARVAAKKIMRIKLHTLTVGVTTVLFEGFMEAEVANFCGLFPAQKDVGCAQIAVGRLHILEVIHSIHNLAKQGEGECKQHNVS